MLSNGENEQINYTNMKVHNQVHRDLYTVDYRIYEYVY
jgi:hypothetical protein